jgi:hypothetical protein
MGAPRLQVWAADLNLEPVTDSNDPGWRDLAHNDNRNATGLVTRGVEWPCDGSGALRPRRFAPRCSRAYVQLDLGFFACAATLPLVAVRGRLRCGSCSQRSPAHNTIARAA